MKKYVLGLFICLFSVISFCSAEDYRLTRYQTLNYPFKDGYTYTLIEGGYGMESSSSLRIMGNFGRTNQPLAYCGKGCIFNMDDKCSTSYGCPEDVYILCMDSPCVFSLTYKEPPIVKGGNDNFSPVITGLFDLVGEFIPLMVFIGFGVLISTLGFVAVRWLMIYVGNKLRKYFRSK